MILPIYCKVWGRQALKELSRQCSNVKRSKQKKDSVEKSYNGCGRESGSRVQQTDFNFGSLETGNTIQPDRVGV
jgi:hypothetical protein